MRFGKIFEQMYESTIRENWKAMVTFQQLIVLSRHGVVDMTVSSIAGRTGLPLEIIQEGIHELQKPDPESRSKAEDGRRIVLLVDAEGVTRPWGWRIVNHQKYLEALSAEERRAYKTAKQREYRERAVDSGGQEKTPVAPGGRGGHTETKKEKEKEIEKEPISPPPAPKPEPKEPPKGPTFLEFWKVYPHHGRGKAEAAKLWAAMPEAARLKAMSAAAAYARQVVGKEAGYVKWASGWLRLKRFEDEVEAPRPEEPPKPMYPSVPLPVCFGDREFWPAWPRWLDEQVRAQEPVPGDWIAAALRWRRGEPQECPEDLAALAPWEKE